MEAFEEMEVAPIDLTIEATRGEKAAVVIAKLFVNAPEGVRMTTALLTPTYARLAGLLGIGGPMRPPKGKIHVRRVPHDGGYKYVDNLVFEPCALAGLEWGKFIAEGHEALCREMWETSASRVDAMQKEIDEERRLKKMMQATK